MIALAALSVALTLGLPLDCRLGTDCFIQNYVDHDTGPGARDVRCGHLTYDGHKGTDFRLKNLAQMQRGVNVLAAAGGTVVGARDGMQDISIRDANANPAAIRNRECGNGVRIAHTSGYFTQYCHMKRGSIRVRQGQAVQTGDVLGQVGLSGDTEFPHVHMQVENDNSNIIDPFAPDMDTAKCAAQPPARALWTQSSHVTYQPVGILQMGFASAPPTADVVRAGALDAPDITYDSPAMIVWAELFGLSAGDMLTMTLTGPDGDTLVTHQQIMDKNSAVYFQFAGRKRKTSWLQGTYTGHVRITRGKHDIVRQRASYMLK